MVYINMHYMLNVIVCNESYYIRNMFFKFYQIREETLQQIKGVFILVCIYVLSSFKFTAL